MKTEEKPIDYSADLERKPGDNVLAQIDFVANAQLDAELDVATCTEALKKAQEKLKDIAERQLPELMDAARQKVLTTGSNVEVKLKDKVRASVPEGRRAVAFALLRERGHGSIIKTSVEIPFEAGRDPAALGLRVLIQMLISSDDIRHDLLRSVITHIGSDKVSENIKAAFAFLGAVEVERPEVVSTVHAQTLAALVRLLLKDGKIDQPTMEVLGAHAWKETEVERKG